MRHFLTTLAIALLLSIASVSMAAEGDPITDPGFFIDGQYSGMLTPSGTSYNLQIVLDFVPGLFGNGDLYSQGSGITLSWTNAGTCTYSLDSRNRCLHPDYLLDPPPGQTCPDSYNGTLYLCMGRGPLVCTGYVSGTYSTSGNTLAPNLALALTLFPSSNHGNGSNSQCPLELIGASLNVSMQANCNDADGFPITWCTEGFDATSGAVGSINYSAPER